MKVRVLIAIACAFNGVASEAPYAPSGYRPPGPKFELPQNQYGSPSDNSLPVLPPSTFRKDNDVINYTPVYYNIYEQKTSNREQNEIFTQNEFAKRNQQYGTPYTPNVRQAGQGTSFNNNNPQPSRNNFDYNNLNKYGTPARQNQYRPQNNGNTPKHTYNRNFYQAASNENQANDFSRDADDEDTVGINNQHYLPPTTTEVLIRKTTESSNRKEPVDSQEDFGGGPNVAVSTSFAKGRYYVLQPMSNLQRLVYSNRASRLQNLDNQNEYSSRLIYQNVAPIAAPFYTYRTPALIRLY